MNQIWGVSRAHASIVYCVRKRIFGNPTAFSFIETTEEGSLIEICLSGTMQYIQYNTIQNCKGHMLKALENLSYPYKPKPLGAGTDYSSSHALCAEGRRQGGEQSCTDHSSQHDVCSGSQRPSAN